MVCFRRLNDLNSKLQVRSSIIGGEKAASDEEVMLRPMQDEVECSTLSSRQVDQWFVSIWLVFPRRLRGKLCAGDLGAAVSGTLSTAATECTGHRLDWK